ncbi:MAG: UMP kinase [Clostridia bacterium]|nr:UMP kinase [Clostridia bacterium]
MSISYKRVLLKLSGEALAGENGIINYDYIREIGKIVRGAVEEGAQIAIVVGAGNIWRGRQGFVDMDRVRADQMGMLATVINALAIQDAFAAEGCEAVVMTAAEMNAFAEHFTKRDAIRALESGKVVIFGGGTGSPFFSTDTTAVLRAAEIEADVIMMAKNIDAIYTADPRKDPNAVRLEETTYEYILENKLGAIDITAASLAMDNGLPLYCFGLDKAENIGRVIRGEKIGTKVNCK